MADAESLTTTIANPSNSAPPAVPQDQHGGRPVGTKHDEVIDTDHEEKKPGEDEAEDMPPPPIEPTIVKQEQGIPQSQVKDAQIPQDDNGTPHTVFTERQKRLIIVTASFAAFISPVSASIYYPSINSLAKSLDVTVTLINLTITTYMVFQGLAPTFIGNFSDQIGRRPAYLICFITYMCANLGLALQTNYAALVVLRCLQSSGSSGTVAIGAAVVADMITRAERGKYMMYSQMGTTLGPALGPLLGGILSQFLGWRAIFWFLFIFAGVMLLLTVLFFPETSRTVVGNGSIPPQTWNRPLVPYLIERWRRKKETRENTHEDQATTKARARRRPNPILSLRIGFERETGLILFVTAILYAGFFMVLSTLSPQLRTRYNFNNLQIGLCYIPYGAGSTCSRWTVGALIDRNFRRHARKIGMEIVKNRQSNLDEFPIENARLQVCLPLVFAGAAVIVIYSWLMETNTSLPGALVALFFLGSCISGSFTSISTLLIDIHKENPGTATAAQNLYRCLFGAGAVAAAVPMVNSIGLGWTGTIVAFVWLMCTPLLWVVMTRGEGWRAEKRRKKAEKEEGLDRRV